MVLRPAFLEVPNRGDEAAWPPRRRFWLALTLFFNFKDETYGGPVAFFSLMGGLGVVLLWTLHRRRDQLLAASD
jgi:hypothetical protein